MKPFPDRRERIIIGRGVLWGVARPTAIPADAPVKVPEPDQAEDKP
jgi:hypothetical protein